MTSVCGQNQNNKNKTKIKLKETKKKLKKRMGRKTWRRKFPINIKTCFSVAQLFWWFPGPKYETNWGILVWMRFIVNSWLL